MQGERGEQRRQALAAAAKDAKLSQLRRNMQALEAKLIHAMQTDAHRSAMQTDAHRPVCRHHAFSQPHIFCQAKLIVNLGCVMQAGLFHAS